MRIAIGCDHRGLNLKQSVIKLITDAGHSYEDLGCYTTDSVDYPDIARKVAEAVARGDFERGILICKSGLGMSMVANKVPGIRAALLSDMASVRSSREHNDANIAVLSGNRVSRKKAEKMLKVWFETEFLGGRHKRRIRQLDKMGKRLKRGR